MRNLITVFMFLVFSTMTYTQESVTLADYQRAERFLSTNTSLLVSHANAVSYTHLTLPPLYSV